MNLVYGVRPPIIIKEKKHKIRLKNAEFLLVVYKKYEKNLEYNFELLHFEDFFGNVINEVDEEIVKSYDIKQSDYFYVNERFDGREYLKNIEQMVFDKIIIFNVKSHAKFYKYVLTNDFRKNIKEELKLVEENIKNFNLDEEILPYLI